MAITIKTTGLEDYLNGGEGHVKALILGEPGVGKTRSASFWPKPILADCEHGRMSVADRSIPYVQIDRPDQLFELLNELERESKQSESMRTYKTLIIDTVDAFQRLAVQERLRTESKEEFNGWADWGYLDAVMGSLMSRIHKLNMNVVMNCHVKISQIDDKSPSVFSPKLKGDYKDQISADFDLVGQMMLRQVAVKGERQTERVIRWKANLNTPILKDRSGCLPDETKVMFNDQDYLSLFVPMAEHLDKLKESEVIKEVQPSVQPAPPDVTGGPVKPKVVEPEKPTKRTGEKSGTKTEQPKTPAKKADKTDQTDEQTDEQAVQIVQKELGGQVVEAVGSATANAETDKNEIPVCGAPGKLRGSDQLNPNPVPGCGKSLEKEDKAQISIALIKTRTLLCQECFKSYTLGKEKGNA